MKKIHVWLFPFLVVFMLPYSAQSQLNEIDLPLKVKCVVQHYAYVEESNPFYPMYQDNEFRSVLRSTVIDEITFEPQVMQWVFPNFGGRNYEYTFASYGEFRRVTVEDAEEDIYISGWVHFGRQDVFDPESELGLCSVSQTLIPEDKVFSMGRAANQRLFQFGAPEIAYERKIGNTTFVGSQCVPIALTTGVERYLPNVYYAGKDAPLKYAAGNLPLNDEGEYLAVSCALGLNGNDISSEGESL